MSNSEKGKLLKLLAEESGQGVNGAWKKRQFVIETAGQYPKKICFEAWGDKVAQLDHIAMGQEIEVFFNLESREYNDKWYTNNPGVWKIKALSGTTSTDNGNISASQTSTDEEDPLPF